MPFINGRYHVNPAMGQALEAAREAEAALLALQQQTSRDSGDSYSADSADPEDPSSDDSSADAGPIHHIEIEVTQLVPSTSGRATRGFVAHVHRSAGVVAPASSPAIFGSFGGDEEGQRAARSAPPPETHVFSHHGDLVNFLRDALATDSSER
jgi:hypothetical protein